MILQIKKNLTKLFLPCIVLIRTCFWCIMVIVVVRSWYIYTTHPNSFFISLLLSFLLFFHFLSSFSFVKDFFISYYLSLIFLFIYILVFSYKKNYVIFKLVCLILLNTMFSRSNYFLTHLSFIFLYVRVVFHYVEAMHFMHSSADENLG